MKIFQFRRNSKKVGSLRERFTKHRWKVGMTRLSLVFSISPAQASDFDKAGQVINSEDGKEALIEVLKVVETKPALSVAAGIVCLACIPAAGAATSLAMCVTCGILLAKVIG